VRINAHDDDVNSCCWADTASGNVLISASDDTFLKVWYVQLIRQEGVLLRDIFRDRRSLGSSQKPAGVLVGHTEGITNVAPKGDGRYIISNGKDQGKFLANEINCSYIPRYSLEAVGFADDVQQQDFR
jgi:DDB1- and CUL4-associated factor 11